MKFTTEQTNLLAGDLDRAHVKEREQAGRRLSYIEGWHAIAEANRIFGFDGWTSETVALECINAAPCSIGKPPNQHPGHAVSYVARVRIDVGGVVREGVGAGHGRDRDLGMAHESAAKEAETDARKRALMTFGNKFGLALYDRTQRNVSAGADDEAQDPPRQQTAAQSPAEREAHDRVAGLDEVRRGSTPLSRAVLDPADPKTWPFNLNDPVTWGKYSGKRDGSAPKTWLQMAQGRVDGERHGWLQWFVESVDKKPPADRDKEMRQEGYRRARAIFDYYESLRVDDPTS